MSKTQKRLRPKAPRVGVPSTRLIKKPRRSKFASFCKLKVPSANNHKSYQKTDGLVKYCLALGSFQSSLSFVFLPYAFLESEEIRELGLLAIPHFSATG